MLASRQWRVVGTMAGLFYLGLDTIAARAIWQDHGITPTPELWQRLRVLEDETASLFNARK